MNRVIIPRYGHTVYPTQGKTYAIATDKPPAELAGFWSDLNFACIQGGNTHERITDNDANILVGVIPSGTFTIVKWLNRRNK